VQPEKGEKIHIPILSYGLFCTIPFENCTNIYYLALMMHFIESTTTLFKHNI
jgi:hypothetical protein